MNAGDGDKPSSSTVTAPNDENITNPPPTTTTRTTVTETPDVLVQIQVIKPTEDAAAHTEESGQLREHSVSENRGGAGINSLGISNEDIQDWTEMDSEMKRVKVYELVGSGWVDQGTAFCFGTFTDGNVALLTARSEKNLDDVILTTTIRSNDVYQRQQETLIVWTEPDGVDYALSFQDPEGCSEVWTFISEVQRHMNGGGGGGSGGVSDDQVSLTVGSSSPLIGPEPPLGVRPGHLPTPQLGMITEIERSIKSLARTQAHKERICEYIQAEDYVKQMIDVMNVAEDIEALDSLHALCSLMQTILMLNDHSMYEHILDDELFYGVCGMLEYDPEFPNHKANYREFLSTYNRFHEPIPIRDPTIQRKIHCTYRLQFLKDVVLARALDDSTFNVLNSCIIFNQIDIITHVQQDVPFLGEIVRLYVDEDMLSGGGVRKPPAQGTSSPPALPDNSSPNGVASQLSSTVTPTSPAEDSSAEDLNKKREVILLIQSLCSMGKNVQLPARMALFRSLVDRGILFAVQWALSQPEKDEASRPIISAGGEILAALLDHDLNGVRGHVLKQVAAIEKERDVGKKGAERAETLVQMVCKMLAQSNELSVQNLVGDALKAWLDCPPVSADVGPSASSEAHSGLGPKFGPRKDDLGTERFMEYFYKEPVHTLFKPFLEVPEWSFFMDPVFPLTREQTNRFMYLCDLLYNFSLQHHFRSHIFIVSTSIFVRVATLFKARDKHLRHASFRFLRLLLKQNNSNMHKHIMKHDILKPILELTLKESRRDNLLSCSCQEYFEFMRRENVKEMIGFCMERHEPLIRKLAQSPLGGQRFQLFIKKFEMNNEPMPQVLQPTRPVDVRVWPSNQRVLDAEEENYFNADDDEDGYVQTISQQYSRGNGTHSPIPGASMLKRKRRALANATKGFRPQNHPPLRSPLLDQLSDYGDEGEDEEPAKENLDRKTPEPPMPPSNGPPPPKRQREEEEDNLLESIRLRSRPQSPAPGMMASMTSHMRPNEKRRRDEDDDDDLVGLIKSKKPDLGTEGSLVSGRTTTKSGDDPPPAKKLKLKLDSSSLAAISTPAPAESEGGVKDADTG